MRIVHLPFYDDNPYQQLLMEAQRKLGHEVFEGGGGGNFLGVALREWNADVVHFHWLHPYILRTSSLGSLLRASRFLLEVAILKARGIGIYWTVHNLVNHDRRHLGIERFFTKRFTQLADRCFVHSKSAAGRVASHFGISPSKLSIVPHGHYISCFPDIPKKTEARRMLGLSEDTPVILFFGRIEAYKKVDELIEAFVAADTRSHLVVAGNVSSPDLKEKLVQLAIDSPQIHLTLERVPDSLLPTYFSSADIVAFPFSQILTSGSVVLAMSLGKAVLAPSVPELQETVAPTGAIWFIPNDSDSLRDAISSCSNQDLDAAGRTNYRLAQNWTWESIARDILAESHNQRLNN